MKTYFLGLALMAAMAGNAYAAQDTDTSPCDGVDSDNQTLECSVYSRQTAETLLKENFQNLLNRVQSQFVANKTQYNDFTNKLKTAQLAWEKLRDADCAVEVFPSAAGSKAYKISENDCIARMSDERSEYLESIAQE
ncbi:lysozyme inhibitor LprI family protein [Pseudomonas sp. DTU_2021_1001937_2_SI_NGA_ILE_001]|uniref:lysozyme inhibitor LprI family protein n=1 Tax=Pseudomonas sp. DTU_2021_1001937_2_SI_NGA_ILE_001 TaxID=3077589 RepID=UPI0028FC2347|nr:lysozyme inhibitor LprI family protein [Pseudomonas sp. DTU_2021_1001937_2_SI_NGA_ILE_001]WNW12240.1 lysozyme inhibitor LprI family protein [Pseudomonas sp. DTU_2021_1001937_2_SI_NGA_ILE_001]